MAIATIIDASFLAMFFYPLVDLFFFYFERYCQKTKKRYEDDYFLQKMFPVAAGPMVLRIVAGWMYYWNFDDWVGYLITLSEPVMACYVYETGTFDDLIDLARSSPMKFSILFTSGPILIYSGALEFLSSIFSGQIEWIVQFGVLVHIYFYSMVGATAADQNYERDDDERDELELDEMGIGYYWIEGLDGMVMKIEEDKYMFAYSVSDSIRSRCSDCIVRLDQVPRWILDALTKTIMERISMEVVGKRTFDPELEIDKFFYFLASPPYVPISEH